MPWFFTRVGCARVVKERERENLGERNAVGVVKRQSPSNRGNSLFCCANGLISCDLATPLGEIMRKVMLSDERMRIVGCVKYKVIVVLCGLAVDIVLLERLIS